MDKFNSINNNAFKKNLENKIWDEIKKKVGTHVDKETVIDGIVDTMLGVAALINEVYDDAMKVDQNPEKINEAIHDSMSSIFIDAFNSLDSCDLEIGDQVVIAQKLCDIVLDQATIVGFNPAQYSIFAKNYAIANEFVVQDCLAVLRENLSPDSIDALVRNARRELNVRVMAVPQSVVTDNVVNPPVEEVESEPNVEEEKKEDVVAELVNKEEELRKAEEAEAQRKAEEDAKRKSEEAEAQRKAEEDAKRKAEEAEAQRRAEEEAKRKAEEAEAQRKAEEEAKAEENKVESIEDKDITPAEFKFIYDQADKRAENAQLTASVKGEIRGILANSGVDKSKVNEIADIVFMKCLFDNNDGIAAYYQYLNKDMSDSQKNRSASSIMDMMLKGVGNNLRTVLNESISNDAVKMVAHQKLLDVIFKNYSPASISDDFDKRYINNYFFDNSKNLEYYYRTYINKNASATDVEEFAESVADARVRIENSNIVVEAPQVEEIKAEELKIEELVVEEPKVEEPKDEVQPEAKDTTAEQIPVVPADNAPKTKFDLANNGNITPAEFTFIYNQADNKAKNSQLTESVKGQMREILANSGVDASKINATVDAAYEKCLLDSDDGIAAYYRFLNDDMSKSNNARSASSIMDMMIKGAGNNIRIALKDSFSNDADKLIAQQKLLDVMLQNYSPIAFVNGVDEKYSNNYFLNDSNNLESYYRSYINRNAFASDVDGFAKSVAESRAKYDEVVRIKIEEEARINTEEEARIKAEEEARIKSEEEATRQEEDFLNNLINNTIAGAKIELAKEINEQKEAERKAAEEAKAIEQANAKEYAGLPDNSAQTMNKFFADKCKAAVESTAVSDRVMKQLSDLVPTDEKLGDARKELVNKVFDLKGDILSYHNDADSNFVNMNAKPEVAQLAERVFGQVYSLTNNCGFDDADRAIVSQKLTNVLMNNYSPAGFIPEKFGEFANNHVLRNSSIAKSVIKQYNRGYSWTNTRKRIVDSGEHAELRAEIKNSREKIEKDYNARQDKNKGLCSAIKENDVVSKEVVNAFREHFEDATINNDSVQAFKKDAMKLFKDAGIYSEVIDLRADILLSRINYNLPKAYDELLKQAENQETFNNMMEYMAKATFELCYNQIEGYRLSNDEAIKLSQQLSNLVLNTFSPVNFANEVSNEKYNDFVINDTKLLESIVGKTEPDKVEEQPKVEEPKVEEKPKGEINAEGWYVRNNIRFNLDEVIYDGEVESSITEFLQCLDDSDLTASVRGQMLKILDDSGVEQSKAQKAVDAIIGKYITDGGIKAIYTEFLEEISKDSYLSNHYMMVVMSNYVSKYINSSIQECFSNPAEEKVAQGKLVNVILNNYSPAAFETEDLSRYMIKDNLTVEEPKTVETKVEEQPKEEPKVEEKKEEKVVTKPEREINRLDLSNIKLFDSSHLRFFVDENKKNFKDTQMTEYIKGQIGEILTNSSLNESKVQSVTDYIFAQLTKPGELTSHYSDLIRQLRGEKIDVGTLMSNMVNRYAENIELSLSNTNEFPKSEDRLVATQKILDVIIKNYSSIAFTKNGNLDKYADGYMFNRENDYFLGRYYYRYNATKAAGFKDVKDFIGKVSAAYEKSKAEDLARESAIKENEQSIAEKEQISVDLSKVDAPKVDAPKVDEPKVDVPKVEANEPEKERIVIKELSENASSIDVSSKIDDIDAPVNLKSKE